MQAALGGVDIGDRSAVNAWDDEAFVAKVAQTGRDHLILAGLSFEVCASLAAIAAQADGYQPGSPSTPAAPSATTSGRRVWPA